MKIFVPHKIKDTGGSSTFAQKFKKGLEEKGHQVFFEFQKDYDILFVIVQCNPFYLIHAKLHKRKIIHRLDGTYFWSVNGWKYFFLNLGPKIIHKFFSDFTVYQSRYSQYCANKFLGKKKNEKCSIIYNGTDLNLFSPEGEKNTDLRDNPNQKIFITVSRFRRKDQIIPLIKALKIYREKYNTNFKFLVIGDFSTKLSLISKQFRDFIQIKFLGKIPNQNLPKFERSADVFLFSHLNPPCPNNIIEAMTCGLPICGVADGSMEELTVPGKNSLLIKAKGDAFWQEREFDYDAFAKNLNILVSNQVFYSENSQKIAEERFSLDRMLDKYLKLFQEYD